MDFFFVLFLPLTNSIMKQKNDTYLLEKRSTYLTNYISLIHVRDSILNNFKFNIVCLQDSFVLVRSQTKEWLYEVKENLWVVDLHVLKPMYLF